MLNFFGKLLFTKDKILLVKENIESFKNILFVNMKISKWIISLTNMCWSCQGTWVLYRLSNRTSWRRYYPSQCYWKKFLIKPGCSAFFFFSFFSCSIMSNHQQKYLALWKLFQFTWVENWQKKNHCPKTKNSVEIWWDSSWKWWT
jgi:hypothetical protein